MKSTIGRKGVDHDGLNNNKYLNNWIHTKRTNIIIEKIKQMTETSRVE